jgi:lysyl-tRNA synthetase, class II
LTQRNEGEDAPHGDESVSDSPQGPAGGKGESELLLERRRKLEKLREEGVDPFPPTFGDRTALSDIRERHEGLGEGEEASESYRVAGRLVARRGHGKAAFLDLEDRSGRLQVHARQDVLGEPAFGRLVGLDLGDLIGIQGIPFRTKRGELSLRVDQWTLLAKSLRPPPEKYHGLADVELRYRHRELDLIASPEARELFELRTKVVAAVRRFLDERGFMEVETPVLQPLYGGALAKPFTTYHAALDRTLYLRIATELYLKRLIVGGLEKVYELGKDFRNEGISHKHNPEFTMLETYEAYADYHDVAAMCEELVAWVAQDVLGRTTIETDGRTIDLAPPWRRVPLSEAILEATGVDIRKHGERGTLLAAMRQAGIDAEAADGGPSGEAPGWGKLVDTLLSKHVEPRLLEPTFVLDYPTELSPFARPHRSEQGLVERFEGFVGGIEIANAFSELNDPEEQRRRLEQQRRLQEAGDEEAQPYDEDFVRALEQGMPPTGGLGLGIDRLVMLLSGRSSLREVILFPALRERQSPAR